MVGTNSRPPPMPIVPLRKPAPKPPAMAIASCQVTAGSRPSSRKDELLQADDAEDHRDGDLELAVRDPAQQPGPQVGADDAADDEEQGGVEVDLRRTLAEVIDGQGGEGDRDDRDERVGIGVALPDARPEHLKGNQDEAATHAEQPSEHAAQKTDDGEGSGTALAVDYSVGRGGVSGWPVTTEWCRNATFGGTAPPGCLAFFFF